MNTLLITQTSLIIDDKVTSSPNNISIILPNGHSYDIEEIIAHLIRLDEQKPTKKRFKFFRRAKNLGRAFKSALNDINDEADYTGRS